MPYIKIGHTLINTNKVVAVELNDVSSDNNSDVVILIAAPNGEFKKNYFSGESANLLRAYFSDVRNSYTIDLQQQQPRPQNQLPEPETVEPETLSSTPRLREVSPRREVSASYAQSAENTRRRRIEGFLEVTPTRKAIKVNMLAQQEAERLGRNLIGTEHLLLGLIGEGTGIAAQVLNSLGINQRAARLEVEKLTDFGSGFPADVIFRFKPKAQHVQVLSREEARKRGHDYVGTEHLLLALIQLEDSVAVRVLNNMGVSLDTIRSQVLQMIGE